MDTLSARVRSTLAPAHARLEAAPFSKAVMDGSVPRGAVVTYLRCLLAAHEALEGRLAASQDAAVRAVWSAELAKTPLLKKDLALTDPDAKGEPLEEAKKLAAHFTVESVPEASLLGALYVFEGSQMGARPMKAYFAKGLGVETDAISYFGCYGDEGGPVWKGFKAKFDAAPFTDVQRDAVAAEAVATMACLEKVLNALLPAARAV
jgi:heme oxygenase